MGRSRSIALFLLFAAVLLLSPGPALAAEGGERATVSTLEVIFQGAGWLGVVIGFFSLASLTVIINHFWTIRRATMAPEEEIEATREMIEARRYKECIDYIRHRKSMFAEVLTAGLRHGRHGFEAMLEAADEQAGSWSNRLFRKVEYLHVIGNLGPLLGLFGTVLGMIRAFTEMKVTHGAYKPEDLAGGISMALVSTLLGLAVAIVSLGFFGICRNRVDSLSIAAHAGAVDLLEYFRPIPNAANGTGPQPTKPNDSPQSTQRSQRGDGE